MDWIPEFILGIVFSIIGYLLHRRDIQQDQELRDIKNNMRAQQEEIHHLALTIAGDHYKKQEIDQLFSMMRQTLREGFDKIDRALHELRMGRSDGNNP